MSVGPPKAYSTRDVVSSVVGVGVVEPGPALMVGVLLVMLTRAVTRNSTPTMTPPEGIADAASVEQVKYQLEAAVPREIDISAPSTANALAGLTQLLFWVAESLVSVRVIFWMAITHSP
ncbi:hypothetical protein CE154_011420 [Alicycliphilus denitrificans]|uniref:Uncharacterized protein n=1 Tax=Alicycliphilus denitrificans TaxID=179636 RepID=A0A3R7EZ35_9BURK|nr:hypothetical protein CE154_011420 [Alicycliphilus denitrificans]